MRVLFITNYPSPYRVQFFNKLGELCDLTVTFEETPEQQTHRSKKWFIKDYANFRPIFLKHGLNLKIGNKRIKTFPDIKNIIENNEFDYIVVGGYSSPSAMSAIGYMQRRHIKYILNADGGQIKKDNYILKCFKKRYISGAMAYLSPSKVTDDYFVYYGANKDSVFRYPFTSLTANDILSRPLLKKEKDVLRESLGLPQNKTILLTIGQFIYRKGFDVLIYAMRNIGNNTILYIVGDEPTEEYKKLIRINHLERKIHFIPFQKKAELFNYLDAADIFILPTRYDAWGLVINEAMARGLPVITTDKCMAGLELINTRNGTIISADNAEAISDAVNKLLSKNSLRKMGIESIRTVKKYTVENMVNRHIEILKQLPKAYDE